MIAALFYWTGAIVWALAVLSLAAIVLFPLLQVLSYYAACIIAAFLHDKWRTIPWYKLPAEFLSTWWEWFRTGAPTSISGPYLTWEGAFKWRIESTSADALEGETMRDQSKGGGDA